MKNIRQRIISFILTITMLLSISGNVFAASNNFYTEGNSENIVISFEPVNKKTFEIIIRNDRDCSITNWNLEFKTNFKLSNPIGVECSIASNNTYSFSDPENGSIASGDTFSFTVDSDKKKNSEIHNVHFQYQDMEDYESMDGWECYEKDSDSDGLPDVAEELLGTDTTKIDTDGDGLTDYDEYTIVLTDPLIWDSIGEGKSDADYDFDYDELTNIEEILLGSDPYIKDSDEDGLADADEEVYGTDPKNCDTDEDGLVDGAEVQFGMNPTDPDTLNDGILDGDRLFDAISENYDALEEYGITTSVNIRLKGNQIHTLSIEKVDITDPFLSDLVPGFVANAFEYNVEGEFDNAVISFEFPETLLENDDFEPAIFYFDEEEQILTPLENQTLTKNVISAETTHFSRYMLLNKKEYLKYWEYDIKFDSSQQKNQGIRMGFVIDYSASMDTNDPDYLRLKLVKNFIEKMRDDIDEASVIKFARYATILSSMTSDKNQLISAVDKISNTGSNTSNPEAGTNGSDGLRKAIDSFSNNDTDGFNYILFLTDGVDTRTSYSYDSLVKEAVEKNIMINCIGLGESIDTALLTQIAEGTGGVYYHAADADKLYGIFEDIDDLSDLKKDTDGDGINDYFEKEMNAGHLRLGTGVPLIGIDYMNSDSDGDSLEDGIELKVKKTGKFLGFIGSEKVYVKLYSNPTTTDTDKDGIPDPDDERPLYPLCYQYLGSEEHLNYVDLRLSETIADIARFTYIDNTLIAKYGVKILMNDYYDYLKYKEIDPTGKSREEYWDSSWDKYWDNYCNRMNTYVVRSGSVNEEVHYFRNNLNRFPETLDQMVSNASGWILLPVGQSTFHMCPTSFAGNGLYNLKFVSCDGKDEVVYINTYGNNDNPNKGLAATDKTDPTNMGTYNYSGGYVDDGTISMAGLGHLLLDITPYNIYGNTCPEDRPSKEYSQDKNKSRFKNDYDASKAWDDFNNNWPGEHGQ